MSTLPIQILMPMAGLGRRFRAEGVTTPRPLIEVGGLPMFARSYASLAGLAGERRTIVVIRGDGEQAAPLERSIGERIKGSRVVVLDQPTRGPVETCLRARGALDEKLPTIILDSDLHFTSREYFERVAAFRAGHEAFAGMVLFHRSRDPRYGYVEARDGFAVAFAEKKAISDQALAGAYFFSSYGLFAEVATAVMGEASGPTGEFFVSQVYAALVARGERIRVVETDDYASFGTPEELRAAARRHWT